MRVVHITGRDIIDDVRVAHTELRALMNRFPDNATLHIAVSLVQGMVNAETPSGDFMARLSSRPEETEKMLGQTLWALVIAQFVRMAAEGAR